MKKINEKLVKRDFLLWNVLLVVSNYQVNIVADVKKVIRRFKSYCDLKSTKVLHLSRLKQIPTVQFLAEKGSVP